VGYEIERPTLKKLNTNFQIWVLSIFIARLFFTMEAEISFGFGLWSGGYYL